MRPDAEQARALVISHDAASHDGAPLTVLLRRLAHAVRNRHNPAAGSVVWRPPTRDIGPSRSGREAAMAWAKITRRWADESELEVEVGCESSYPDAVAEIVSAVVRLDSQAAPEDSE